MKMKSIFLVASSVLALSSAAKAADAVIYPYDGAKVLVGQKFDLRIEVSNLKGNDSYTVNLDGKAVNGLVKSSTGAGKTDWTLRQISFSKGGTHTLELGITDDSGTSKKTFSWEAVANLHVAKAPKKIILFIGDGMGWNTLNTARIVSKGYNAANGTPNGNLLMESGKYTLGTVTTSSYDSFLTDSANTASSIASGQKILVNALNVYPDNTADSLDNPRIETIAEMLKRSKGMGIGLVSTAFGTDATPAAFAAHTRLRGDYAAIADQYFKGSAQPDVLMFGGSRDFIPSTAAGSRRKDNVNWIDDSQKMGFQFVSSRTELMKADSKKVFGLFNIDNITSYLDRAQYKNPAMLGDFKDMPYLWDMTQKAVETLNKNENGFFLMVEAGMIDKYEHPLDWQRGIWDTLELDKTVQWARDWAAKNPDTLILVTADHAHSISTFGGYDLTKGPGQREAVGIYQTAGFPDYFKSLDANGIPMIKDAKRGVAVGFAATPDYCESFVSGEIYQDPTISDGKGGFLPNPEICKTGYARVGNLPKSANQGVHTADPLPLFAYGLGAEKFAGVMDQTELFFKIAAAVGLNGNTKK
jgi:alkaline phosphatase